MPVWDFDSTTIYKTNLFEYVSNRLQTFRDFGEKPIHPRQIFYLVNFDMAWLISRTENINTRNFQPYKQIPYHLWVRHGILNAPSQVVGLHTQTTIHVVLSMQNKMNNSECSTMDTKFYSNEGEKGTQKLKCESQPPAALSHCLNVDNEKPCPFLA